MTRWEHYGANNGPWAIAHLTRWLISVQQPRVLIIDDDTGLARIVSLVLGGSGFVTDVANSGDDGLKLAAENHYDAVVLDLRMPGKDGRTVFREMREAGIRTPVMILSAFDARQARDELGAQAFLNKPFEPDRLVSEVQAMLTRGS